MNHTTRRLASLVSLPDALRHGRKGLIIAGAYFIYNTVLRHLKQVLIAAGVYVVYMLVRHFLIHNIESAAFENAVKVISLESAGGFLWELHWQQWMIEHSRALVIFFNWVYIITFWPIILITAVLVYILDRPKYFYYRNVVLLSFVLALIIFALFPLAPPRYLPEYGFVDAIQQFGPSQYGGSQMAIYYNSYAAMPSLHFGWTILFGALFFRMKHMWLKPFGLIYPAMTLSAITISGNHYIFDAVGGAAVMISSFLIYGIFVRVNSRSTLTLAVARPYLGRAPVYLYSGLLRWKNYTLSALIDLKPLFKLERVSTKRRRTGLTVHTWERL